MTVQTYCVIADVKDILSDNGVLYRTDDNEDGSVAGSGTESTVQSHAIEFAAVKMNMYLQQTAYTLTALANNEWCKWCNAVKAAVILCRRRGNPVPNSLLQEEQEFERMLEMLRKGTIDAIPGTNPSFETTPVVTNFTTEPWRRTPVRRRDGSSTGQKPPATVKRHDEVPHYSPDDQQYGG